MIISFYAALLGLMFVVLTANVALFRRKNMIALGDSGNFDLIRRMRAQANFVETVPIALILLMMSEMMGAPVWAVNLGGLALVAGRIAHASSLLFIERYENGVFKGGIMWRPVGMGLTLTTILASAIFLIIRTLV